MRLNYIKLENFRQFKNLNLEFAKERDKNITIIMGDNGAGKTTLAQAFFWCFYGETSFKTKELVNIVELEKKSIGEKLRVKVELSFDYNAMEYFLVRETEYIKKDSNRFNNIQETKVYMSKKNKNGEMEKVNFEKEIRKILPKELSKYFFFDGERIEKMSKDIQDERHAEDFSEAVKGLLGLNGMISAIKHLKSKKIRNNVIKKYNEKISLINDSEISQMSQELNICIDEIESIDEELKELIKDKEKNFQMRDICIKELQTLELSKNLQKKRDEYEKKINEKKNYQEEKILNMFRVFHKEEIREFLYENLVKDALKELENYQIKDSIPGLNSKILNFLLKEHKCICGRKIEENSNEYNNIYKLLNNLSKNSKDLKISNFKSQLLTKLDKKIKLLAEIKEYNNDISILEDEILDLEQEIYDIDEKLSDKNLGEKINELNKNKKDSELNINKIEEEEAIKREKKGEREAKRKELEVELKKISEKNKESERIILYKEYAESIYEFLCKKLEEKERIIRNELQETINQIFKEIFNGELSLEIGEKYNVYVTAKNYETETSTAQSIAVIFAFISGIIKLARKYQKEKENISEPYPLVMDAPLSAFDKYRICTICNVLPNIAEQVVIFIKDTDGDIAKENLKNKIGKFYTLNKINDFYTTI